MAKTVPEKIAKIVPKLVPNTRKKPTKKMPRLEQFHRLHENLVQELTLFEAQTAAQKFDLTEHAELIGVNRYKISGVLRGQAGSDYAMVASLDAGARCVLVDRELGALPLQETDLANGLNLRYGPASMARDSYAWQSQNYNPRYSGARCLSPVHIRSVELANHDIRMTWIRRSREGTEDFEAFATPLDQPFEAYQIQLWYNGTMLREESSASADWIYSLDQQIADGFEQGVMKSKTSSLLIAVAQISSLHGAGFRVH